ncbi:hypothetical protein QEZ54_17130 [Catellatospora sp. KI3]|uniref:hypothetical protein n=1 Tax=Catellatospora sp. KI3 TaxID=3041620 RepID=UPI0024832DE3|nr:hypothetical protein [Catellatospora sp. KI3]MDI1462700.1 hypothetical protein [Catellatospora sp. KI3]
MSEQWRTVEDINAARRQREDAIAGYEPPAAFSLGRLVADRVEFAYVNVGIGLLPAVIVAGVCGHVSGSAAYRLTVGQFDAALAELAPAEACTDLPHPNLWSWRALRAGMSGEDQLIAVYADDLGADSPDPHVAALLAAAAGR